MPRTISLVVIVVIAFAATSQAAVPTSITVQGKLTDSTGAPFAPGSKQFVFSIHDSETGGSKIWPTVDLEYQMLVTDASGLWSANVGSVVPLPDFVFLDTVRWLEVAVDVGGPVVLPRIRMVTGPYTFRVSTVDGASGGTITSKLAIGPGHTNSGEQGFTAGADNFARGAYSSVSGGKDNIAFSDSTHVGGGGGNTAFGLRATVGGGANNETGGEQATVAGGRYNKALGLSSSVGGGYENIATGVDAHIGGGSFDSASGNYATVAGGSGNKATGDFNTIGGGGGNRTSATSATVAGGFQNSAAAIDATIGGGFNNTALGSRSTVGGGTENLASGYASTVPGGDGNAASGNYSFAAGRGARAIHEGSFIWNSSLGGGLLSTTAPFQFIINAEGGTGIGARSPKSPLHVGDFSGSEPTPAPGTLATFSDGDGNGYISILSPPAYEKGILFGDALTPAGGGVVYDDAMMQFRTNGNTTRMVLSATGRLGIGETAPEAPLHVKDGSAGAVSAPAEAIATFEKSAYGALSIITPTNAGSAVYFGNPLNIAAGAIAYDATVDDGFAFVMAGGAAQCALTNTGLGLGDLTPDAKLDVVGDVLVTGNVCAANLACASDERLKQDIHPIPNALEDVQKLSGVEFRWTDDVIKSREWSKTKQIGLLAQDVKKVAPEAVVEMPDGFLAVDYARLVPMLIEAIKEQQQQINDLKTRLDRQ